MDCCLPGSSVHWIFQARGLVILKVLQARLQQIWTVNFQMFKLDLEMAEEPVIKLPTSVGSLKQQESSRNSSTSALLTMPSLWLCRPQQTVENSSSDGNTRPPDLPVEKSVCRFLTEATVRTRHGATNWFQIGKSTSSLYIVTLLI